LQHADKQPIFVQKLLMMKSKELENAHGGNGMPFYILIMLKNQAGLSKLYVV
jgi:hypothetical protein